MDVAWIRMGPRLNAQPRVWHLGQWFSAYHAPKKESKQTTSQDCACAQKMSTQGTGTEAPVTLEAWRVALLPSRLQRAPAWVEVPLGDGEHWAYLSPYQPRGLVAVLNQAARALWQRLPPRAFAITEVPTTWYVALAGFYQAGLLLDAQVPASDFTSSTATALSLWVEVTRGCNLDCPYCYVPKDGPVLSMSTLQAVLPSYLQEAARRGIPLRLKFAGGEPTLAWSHFQRLYRWARSAAQEAGAELQPVLLTNGTLLNAQRLAFLAQEGFFVAFSLDGVGPGHDAQRATRRGAPTAARVREAVEQARALGVPFSLTNTITRHNVDEIPAFVAFALDLDAPFNLNFYRPTRWPDPLVPPEDRLIASLRAAMEVLAARLPQQRLIDGLLDRARFDAPHAFVCDAGRSYHALDVHGRTAACPMLLGAASDLAATFRVPAAQERAECATCSWRFWCGGGCPITAAQVHGSMHAPSPYCRVYQALYPDLVRLEGLRVLRYGQYARSPLAV